MEVANNFYEKKNYALAIEKIETAMGLENTQITGWDLYFFASCLSMDNRIDDAFKALFDAVNNYPIQNYTDYIYTDKDLEPLHSDARWDELINTLKTKMGSAEK